MREREIGGRVFLFYSWACAGFKGYVFDCLGHVVDKRGFLAKEMNGHQRVFHERL